MNQTAKISRRRKEPGFTLIELIAVLAIIGGLAAFLLLLLLCLPLSPPSMRFLLPLPLFLLLYVLQAI